MPRLRDYMKVPDVDLSDIAKSDTARLIVLRRAQEDRLMLDRPGGDCFDRGQLLGAHLLDTVPMLIDELLLEVVEHTHERGFTSLRVVPTEAGARWLADLTEQKARDRAVARPHLVGVGTNENGSV